MYSTALITDEQRKNDARDVLSATWRLNLTIYNDFFYVDYWPNTYVHNRR